MQNRDKDREKGNAKENSHDLSGALHAFTLGKVTPLSPTLSLQIIDFTDQSDFLHRPEIKCPTTQAVN